MRVDLTKQEKKTFQTSRKFEFLKSKIQNKVGKKMQAQFVFLSILPMRIFLELLKILTLPEVLSTLLVSSFQYVVYSKYLGIQAYF